MANILVYIEQHEGYIVDCTLKAINVARELASQKGAVLYGILATNKNDLQDQQLISVLSTFKLDKLIIVQGEMFGKSDRFDSAKHLSSFIKKLNPVLFLLGDSPFAREYSSWIAGKLNGTFISEFLLSKYDHLTFKEEYPYSNQVFEVEEYYIERPIVAIVKQSDYQSSSVFTSMEVKVENVQSKSTIEVENTINPNYGIVDTLLVVGSKILPQHLKKLKEIAKANEWYIASALPEKYNFKSIVEIPVSGCINNFILWECSQKETLLVSFWWASSTKVLLIKSDYSDIAYPKNTVILDDNIENILKSLNVEKFK